MMAKMGVQKGTVAMVVLNLRKGFTLQRSCETAGLGRGALQHRRKKDPRLNAQIMELLSKNKAKPSGRQNVHMSGKGTIHQPGTLTFWKKWDEVAKKGKLRKVYGMGIAKMRPRVRPRWVLP